MAELSDTVDKNTDDQGGKPVGTQPAAVRRAEHILKKAIKQGGEDKKKGDKVMLRPDQAERLKADDFI